MRLALVSQSVSKENFVAFLAATILASAPASAQLSPEPHVGSRLPQKADTAASDQTRRVVREFAECVVKRQRDLASRFVLDRSTLQLPQKYRGLADGYCLESVMDPFYDAAALRLNGASMRFAIAEALLRPEIATIDPSSFSAVAALPLPILQAKDYEPDSKRRYTADQLKELDEGRKRDELALVQYRFGECIVRSDGQASRAFLETAEGSEAEGLALQALMPSLGNCVEKGAEFRLNKVILRGTLAFSFYNLAHAVRGSSR